MARNGIRLCALLSMERRDIQSDEHPTCVRDYFRARDKIFPNSLWAFPNDQGDKLTGKAFNKHLSDQLRLAGINALASPRALSPDEFNAFADWVRYPLVQACMATGLIALMGLRPSEVAALQIDDVDFDNELIWLRDTKSRQDQDAFIPKRMVEPLSKFVKNLHRPPETRVFLSRSGVPWSRVHVRQAVTFIGQMLDIPNLVPRQLRKTFGTRLSRMGVRPAQLARIMRHADPATTLRHYVDVDECEIRSIMEVI
jgi:integrase